jgi:dihydroxyacetone kinase
MENPKAHNAKLQECKEKSEISQDCTSALQAKRRIEEGDKLSYKSVEWYMNNAKARDAKLKECEKITFKSMNADCKNASAAEERVKQPKTKK